MGTMQCYHQVKSLESAEGLLRSGMRKLDEIMILHLAFIQEQSVPLSAPAFTAEFLLCTNQNAHWLCTIQESFFSDSLMAQRIISMNVPSCS